MALPSGSLSPGPGSENSFDPRAKLVLTLAAIIGISLLPAGQWIAFGATLLGLIAVAWIAGLSPIHTIRRSYVAIPFALAALTLPFTVPGDPLGHLSLLGWKLTAQGLTQATTLIARSWLAVQAAILLTSTTPPETIFWSLRALRVPAILVAVVGFAYRYLSLLVDEARRMLRARWARSARRPGRRPALAWQGQVAGSMAGSLFVRSLERSERVFVAMLARGYDGRFHLAQAPQMRWRDWFLLTLAALAVTLLALGA